MRQYELVLVVRPVAEAERKKVLESVKGWLKGMNITKEDEWGEKALAYKIKQQKTGYYVDYMLESESVIPMDFEKRLQTNDAVLRHLLIRTK